MGKRVKYQHLKDYRFYTTLELAKLLNVSRSGVQYWSHHGLEPIDRKQRRWKFNGKDVKLYLKRKNNQFKKKTAPGEVHCLSCRLSRRVIVESIKLKIIDRNVGKNHVDKIMIFGICVECGNQCTKISSSNCIGTFLTYYPDFKGKIPGSSNKR